MEIQLQPHITEYIREVQDKARAAHADINRQESAKISPVLESEIFRVGRPSGDFELNKDATMLVSKEPGIPVPTQEQIEQSLAQLEESTS